MAAFFPSWGKTTGQLEKKNFQTFNLSGRPHTHARERTNELNSYSPRPVFSSRPRSV